MEKEYINEAAWGKIFSFFKTLENIYVGQESALKKFMEAVFGSREQVRNGACCRKNTAAGTRFLLDLMIGQKRESGWTCLIFS